MTDVQKVRDTGTDLLKILLALMVISVHFNAPATGHVASSVTDSTMMHIIGNVVALCYPAVNCYIVITGFYSYKHRKSYHGVFCSLMKLWFCLVTFSVMGYFLMSYIDGYSIQALELIKRIFPVSRGEWWFMSRYFLLMLISPMINIYIDSYSKRELSIILTVAIILFSIIPFFEKYNDSMDVNNGGSIIWFMTLYVTGAFLYKYMCEKRSSRNSIKYLICFLFVTFMFGRINSLCNAISFLNGYHVSMYNSIIVYLQAVFLFLTFWNLSITSKKIGDLVVFFAGLSLASYIFHCQEDIGPFIWKTINPSAYCDSFELVPVYFFTLLGIYIISVIIEYVRKKCFSYNNIENRLIGYFLTLFHKYLNV